MMITTGEAKQWIAARLREKPSLVVALDGRAAAGKTTFAATLTRELGGSVVHMDDFFLPASAFTPARQALPGGNIDEQRFREQALAPLARGEAFCYTPFDCHVQALRPPVAVAGPLVVVEGAYALLPQWGDYFDLALFMTVTPQEQRRRLLKRNGPEGLATFLSRWIPREESYFAACGLPDRCHALVDGAQ